MGIFDSILSAGERFLSDGDSSPFGSLIGGVIDVAGKDGWDGIVDQVSNADSGFWGSAVAVAKDQLGPEYGGLIDGIKGVADGDTDAVLTSVIGGVRDYVGDDRFDSIATTVGQAVNGQTDQMWGELTGHITEAVGNDTFTEIVGVVNGLGGNEIGGGWLASARDELEEVVGAETWGYVEQAAGIHAEIAADETEPTTDQAAETPLSEHPEDGLIDPFEDQVDGEVDSETVNPFDEESDDSDFGLTTNPFDDQAGARPPSPFGDTPLEDILESSEPATADLDLGDVVAPGTGYVPEAVASAPVTEQFEMGAGFPGGPPIDPGFSDAGPTPADATFVAMVEPAQPVEPVEIAPVEFETVEPVSDFQADVAQADGYSDEVDSFFDGVGAGAEAQ